MKIKKLKEKAKTCDLKQTKEICNSEIKDTLKRAYFNCALTGSAIALIVTVEGMNRIVDISDHLGVSQNQITLESSVADVADSYSADSYTSGANSIPNPDDYYGVIGSMTLKGIVLGLANLGLFGAYALSRVSKIDSIYKEKEHKKALELMSLLED